MAELRNDIQALRGLAVSLVVLHHAKFGWLDAGYLGVDIFFVISGYLITTLVATRIEAGDFSLADFYLRRAKRLLPAAYVVFAATAMVAPWVLDQQGLRDLAWQVVGAVTFTANIHFWQHTGYFEGASELKLLLHTWSLSIEEQYYLVLPAALLRLPRRLWPGAVALALVVSLAACLVAVQTSPSATFYLLPTRGWELLLGSFGALLMLRARWRARVASSTLVRAAFWPGVAALFLVPVAAAGLAHPGPGALVVCGATLVVLVRRHPGLDTSAPARWLARIGDVSYSLYLVHWPVLALLRNSYTGTGDDIPAEWRLLAIALSLALALALHRWVEEPLRRSRLSLSPALLAKALVASLALVAIVPLAARWRRHDIDFGYLLRANQGLSPACAYQEPFVPRPECQSGPDPRVLVWGDSHAMHLVPGLVAEATAPAVIQATKGVCGPLLGVGPERTSEPGGGWAYDTTWARGCVAFNDSVMTFVEQRPDIETVVLSSPLVQYVDPEWTLNRPREGRWERVSPSVAGAAQAIVATVSRLRAAGKRVVFFAPPPSTGHDVARCLQREIGDRLSWGSRGTCAIPRHDYRQARRGVLAVLDSIERAGVPVIRLDAFLCGEQWCRTLVEGTMIYRDHGHLSHDGSRLLARRMGWRALVRDLAR